MSKEDEIYAGLEEIQKMNSQYEDVTNILLLTFQLRIQKASKLMDTVQKKKKTKKKALIDNKSYTLTRENNPHSQLIFTRQINPYFQLTRKAKKERIDSEVYKIENVFNFTKKEDDSLLNALSNHDELDILALSLKRPIETLRWRTIQLKALANPKKKTKWTTNETQLLVQSVIKHGNYNWKQIAYSTETHGSLECFHHWHTKANPMYKRRVPWCQLEDAKLIQLYRVYSNNWEKIAEHMAGRTDLQCRERYCNVLDSKIKHKQWTEEEDAQLMMLCCKPELKGKWSLIANKLVSRTDNQCWRRWRKIVQNYEKKVCMFMSEELQKLSEIKYGLPAKRKLKRRRPD